MAGTDSGEKRDRKKEVAIGEVVVSEYVALDGVMEDPAGTENLGRRAWSFRFDRGAEGDRFKLEEALGSEALLLGRTTYDAFAGSWPSREGELADKLNAMRKYVVSTTLEEPLEWNNSPLIEGDVAEEVDKLKRQDGKDILVYGSGQLVRTLTQHDLIDEYRLMVFPIIVGKGKRFFGDTRDTRALKLVETRPVGSDGFLVLTYRPASEQENDEREAP